MLQRDAPSPDIVTGMTVCSANTKSDSPQYLQRPSNCFNSPVITCTSYISSFTTSAQREFTGQ